MNEDTLERTLRQTLTAVAATTRVEDRWPEVAVVAAPARDRHRPLLIVVAAFVVVLVTVGSFALVTALVGGDRGVVSPPADPTETTGVASLRYPVPGYIPADARDVWGQIPFRSPDSPQQIGAVVGRRTLLGAEAPGIDRIVAIYIRQARPGDGEEDGESVAAGSRQVVQLQSGPVTGSVSFTWTEGAITATVVVPSGDVEEGLAVIEGVTLRGDDPGAAGALIIEPPAGLEIIAEPTAIDDTSGGMVTIEKEAVTGPTVTLGVAQPVPSDIVQIDIIVSATTVEQELGSFPAAQAFELRDRPAYNVFTWGYTAVIWEEAPGMTVSVGGWRADATELIRIAEGLEFTDEESWRSLFDVFDPAGVPPTTRAG